MKFTIDNTYMRSLPIRGVKSSFRMEKDVFSIQQYVMIC